MSIENDENNLYFSVKDNGCGMTKEKLFYFKIDPFKDYVAQNPEDPAGRMKLLKLKDGYHFIEDVCFAVNDFFLQLEEANESRTNKAS